MPVIYSIEEINSKNNTQYFIKETNGHYLKQMDLLFNSKEEAKKFAKKEGITIGLVDGKTKFFSKNDIENALFEGDCLELLKQFPDASVDMVLCDLPYGTTQNKWDSVIDLNELWKQYNRIVKLNGAIVLTAQGIFTAKLILSNEENFKYKISWEKSKSTNFLNAKKQPLRKHEDVCVFYRKQPTYNPQMRKGEPYDKGVRKNQLSGSYGDFKPRHVKSNGERYPTDVVYFKTAESEGKVWHPTQKPVELARYLIKTYSNKGDVILDNTFGSGSFLLAAAIEERKFCGIEKNQNVNLFKKESIDYMEVAEERLKKIDSDVSIKIHREYKKHGC